MSFREDFVWGVATSSIQIEGCPTADGGGESVWDDFCRKEGAVAYGDNAEIACDSYHRYREDIDIIASMGLRHYRLSTSWARIDPDGSGNWNAKGLEYYDRVVDYCLEKGIHVWMTLHHWELPLALEKEGGWLNEKTADAFERFASMMAEHFKGRVGDYITINEIECIIGLGYEQGLHAPGKRLPIEGVFRAWKNLMLAHGKAGRAIRKTDGDAQIGLVTTGRLCWPREKKDEEAARREMFALHDHDWTFTHDLVLDAACFGRLYTDKGTRLDALASEITAEEWEIMHFPPDFVGLNLYNGHEIYADENGEPVYSKKYAGFPRTSLKWPVTPKIMDEGVGYIYERYKRPVIITECGLACCDWVHLDGKIHDADRIDFLHRYLAALKSCADRADIRGFFHWSLMDNFEWHSGYTERFGIVYVDYPTGTRTLKDSAYWYAQTAAENGKNL